MRASRTQEAENSAVGGSYCRGRRAAELQKPLHFVGFFMMAWRLLIIEP
jgi:hypothetical protein